MSEDAVVAHTVADLIRELSKLPPEVVPISLESPFDGVKIVPQTGGKVLLCPLPGRAVVGRS